MEQLSNISDFIDLIIYFAIFAGITIYSIFKEKKKTQNKNNNDDVIQNSSHGSKSIQTSWKSNRKNNLPYKISRNNRSNPIFGNATNNISYTRTLMLFLAAAVAAVLLIAYFTGVL